MIVQYFLKWSETAKVSERAAAANALARALIESEFSFEDRCNAEAALTLLVDDPSPKVRAAIAQAFSVSANAPVQIVAALAADQPEVSAHVLIASPLLDDNDLIDRVALGCSMTQRLIASRPRVSIALSAAIAEVGVADACCELLTNPVAMVADLTFRRIAERHGNCGKVREALLSNEKTPADVRHSLLSKVGDALRESGLVRALIGDERARKITRDACVRASVRIIENTPAGEHAALVEHMRMAGDLTAAFIIRTVAYGKVDFFGAVLVALAGQREARVRSLMVNGRDSALTALFSNAGIGSNLHSVLLCALKVWREVANGKRVAGPQEVSWLMLREIGAAPGQAGPSPANDDLAAILKSIHLDVLRENARGHALAIAAA